MRSQNKTQSNCFDYSVSGQGPAIIFLHGWPFHKETYRKLIPLIEPHYRCYNLNSLGMSNRGLACDSNKMNFHDHAARVIKFAEHIGLKDFNIVAHDTGATIARIVAAENPERVNSLVLFNTEIPFHRPPFIPMYQRLFKIPGSSFVVKTLLKSELYCNSAMAYGACFSDKALINDEFKTLFVNHFINNKQCFEGLRQYLLKLDFNIIDTLDSIHKKITAPTMYLWGENDNTFPVELGNKMARQMPSCNDFVRVKDASFLPHEEQASFVAQKTINFLRQSS